VDVEVMRDELNFANQTINLALLELQMGSYSSIKENLSTIVQSQLGGDFAIMSLSSIFQKNENFIFNLGMYPGILIVVLGIISIISLYNYQKSGIMDKAKDFLIMKAIGSKYQNLRKILFLESAYVILPSLFLSLGIGMILNSIVLFDRVALPHLSIPFMLISIMSLLFLAFNYISLFPLMKKVKKFTIKDFEIY
jgi:ABC-type antimicrobial peptide transport system permease subunit